MAGAGGRMLGTRPKGTPTHPHHTLPIYALNAARSNEGSRQRALCSGYHANFINMA